MSISKHKTVYSMSLSTIYMLLVERLLGLSNGFDSSLTFLRSATVYGLSIGSSYW